MSKSLLLFTLNYAIVLWIGDMQAFKQFKLLRTSWRLRQWSNPMYLTLKIEILFTEIIENLLFLKIK